MPLKPDDMATAAWHSLSDEKALELLDAGEEGLSEEEAGERRKIFGANRLPRQRRVGLLRIFARQFKDPLVYVLLAAGLISLAIGNSNNAVFIFAVLLINSPIGTVQEMQAESSAASLQEKIEIKARIIRQGRRRELESTALVPGDIVLIEAGISVPADIRLLATKNLQADESLLTGESLPVGKRADKSLAEDTPLGDRINLLHAGTSIVSGEGKGVVCRTGAGTEMGKIAVSLARGETQLPPLVIKLERFTRMIAVVILVALGLLAAIQLWKGAALTHVFFLSVALAVSAIPAGLPVAITVAMSIASNRMAKRNVIVRQLAAVEGLGSCTLVASDKTGTLTANILTVKRIRLPEDKTLEVEGEGYDPRGEVTYRQDPLDDDTLDRVHRLAVSGALCNEGEFESKNGEVKQSGDSVDVAFLVLAAKLGINRQELQREHTRVGSIPFRAKQRFAAAFHEGKGKVRVHVKGAAEAVGPMCGIDAESLAENEKKLARQGYRLLAVAGGTVEKRSDGDYRADMLRDLEFLGLVALIDPIRPGVAEAIEHCHSAGVDVRMITGDHPDTGLAIGRKLGIAGKDDEVVTGRMLRELEGDREALMERIRRAKVFARVEPTQKTGIVECLQESGHFVAVTGDGVNDAPALKKAHIGVAMGEGGTDVARRAASLILTDDNFASIVNGIEEGRTAYDNVRKVTWLLLSTGAAEVLLFFLAIFSGLPLPLGVVQLLWLNLVTNGIQDVALAFEKTEPGVLRRDPRPPDQPIFDRRMIHETVLSGCYIGLVAFGAFYYLISIGGVSEFEARNLLLLLMVLFENMHTFSCRSETRSLIKVPVGGNPFLVLAVIAAQGAHIVAMFVPVLNDTLQIEPVSSATWLTLMSIAASLLVFDEVAKMIHSRSG